MLLPPKAASAQSVAPGGGVVAASDDLVQAGAIAEVTVKAEAPPSTGSKLGEPRRDVPATVNVVTAETLRERATLDLATALSNVPGMNAVLTYGGFNEIQIRGFSDYVLLRDGVRDDRSTVASSAPWTNLADVDRIEVLKGPASVLYGFSGIGGVINLIRKQPTEELQYEASVTGGGPELLRRATLGLGGPLGTPKVLYRVDVGLTDDTDFRRTEIDRSSVSAAIEVRPGDNQRLRLRAAFSRDRYTTDAGIPTDAGRIPSRIARDRRFNTPQDSMAYRWYEIGAEYTIEPIAGIRLAERASYVQNPYTYFSAEGLALGRAADGSGQVERSYLFFGHDWRPFYNQLELSVARKLLVEHRFLAGYELGWMHSTHPGSSTQDTTLAPVGFAPAPDPQPQIGVDRDRLRVRDQVTHGVYAHDTLALLASLKLVLGVRADWWRRETRTDTADPEAAGSFTRGDEVERKASALTWRAGVVYQPSPIVTAYASAATAFVPIATVPADGTQLDPERGRQMELGAQLEPVRGLHLEASLYDIEKTDVVVARPDGLYEQAGRVSSRGVELNAELQSDLGVSMRAGYAWTHARYRDYVSGDEDYSGNLPPFVFEHGATFWGTYRHSSGWGVGLGARVLGRAFGDTANEVPLPAYGLLDAALFYRWSIAELALNASNVLDNNTYLTGAINDSQVYPGPPRALLVSLRLADSIPAMPVVGSDGSR